MWKCLVENEHSRLKTVHLENIESWRLDSNLTFGRRIDEVVQGMLTIEPSQMWTMETLLKSKWLFVEEEKQERELIESIKREEALN